MSDPAKPKDGESKDEEPSVKVFIRPLEVTVPADYIQKPDPPPKTYWSTMTSRIETETSVKRWSIPPVTTEEGKPPGPEAHPSTKEGKEQEGRVIGITPNYKIGEGSAKQELNLGKSGFLPNGHGDYKMTSLQESYKQTIIDPKVISNANMPYSSTRIPDARRNVAGDFPSEHSKRSQIKLEPLEQRRFRSSESRPISTSNYLTESVERHREMEASKLKEYLKAKESDANQPWNKPGWPGPKKAANDESLRELETVRQRVETLKKKTSQSMSDLSVLPTPSQFEQLNPQPAPSPISPGNSGWLINLRKNRYLDHAGKSNEPKRYRSMDQLPIEKVPESEGSDQLHWQLRKEFHLAKYSERRSSYHIESSSFSSSSHPPPPNQPRHYPPPPASPPPIPEVIQQQIHPPQQPPPVATVLNRHPSKSQLLYPPGSTDNIASEHKPAIRPPEKVVHENHPINPASLNAQHPDSSDLDYPARLMSPPPTHQPRSILKGYTSQYLSQTNLSEYQSHQSHQAHHQFIQEQQQQPNSNFQPQQMHPRPSDRRTPTHFEDLSEDEKTRIMHENLQKHRNMRSGPNGPRPMESSFNGPFFRLEQVDPKQRSHSVDPEHHHHQQQPQQPLKRQEHYSSELELSQTQYSRNLEPSVVVWPPISENERKRPNSVLAKNFNDPDKIDEYQRQKRLEQEAMQRHEHQQMVSLSKQIRAMEIQQQRFYEQSHGVTSPVPMMEEYHPQQSAPPPPPPPPQQQQYYPGGPTSPQPLHDPEPHPHHVQIFETRPISAMSDVRDPQGQIQESKPSWKRTYIVEKKPRDMAKNEILTSEELLEKDSYDLDLLKRRETFVEKPDEPVKVNRLGKRWQPPPEKPYVWPTLHRAMSAEPTSRAMNFTPGVPVGYDEDEEYKWTPIVTDPGYKKEEKNFTPVSSPPASPRRGHGAGPLDEPARRQTKYVIQPSPDGSHRPKAAFRKSRNTPSGGFYPHAPNAIKVVKKRAQSVQGLLSPTDNEIIHQRNYHRLDLEQNGHHKLRRSQQFGGSEADLRKVQDLPDWEKIYELPPHSSQIVQKDMPRHVDVQRRLSKFEGSIQNLRSATASQQHLDSMHLLHFPMPDYEPPQPPRGSVPPPPPPMPNQPREMSRRNSVASTRIDSPYLMAPQQHQQPHHQQHRQSRSDSRGPTGQSRAASSIPLSPQPTPQYHHHHSQRPTTPGATRARNYIARATAPSPTPYSYDRARAYVPPALPPGYREANKPPANAELDELSRRAAELRSRDGRSKYKLIDSEIYKTDPDPMPNNFKDQIRDLLESRNSMETTTTQREADKSGYVTDVSTATWNFSTLDYSPRSVISVNGARDDILKKVPPLRTKTPPPPPPPAPPTNRFYYEQHERYTSAPNLQSAVIRIQDDKPRSIMKRRELESREQLLYPTVDTQVVKSFVRKPTVTETVQRFEETRRTEEVERRVQRREKKERRSRHHSSSRHQSGWEGHTGGYHEYRHGAVASLPRRQVIREADRAMTEEEMNKVVREAYAAADEARRDNRHRSSSLSRGGYLPGGQETYYRQETTRRQQHDNYDDNFNRGIAHARYGSLSDSLRRGELKYIPNGEVRESFYRDGGSHAGGQRMHKSYSTRDVFTGGADDRRSVSSFRRGSQQQVSPFVEFPPTLPRRGDPYREDPYFRPVSKSRSYADWDDAGRAGFGREVRRHDDDMSRLEAEFRDSLLMPMPAGNMNERDHRTEQLPGGYETFNKERHANAGQRAGRDGKPVDFSEASQEYNYKREQSFDDRRRR